MKIKLVAGLLLFFITPRVWAAGGISGFSCVDSLVLDVAGCVTYTDSCYATDTGGQTACDTFLEYTESAGLDTGGMAETVGVPVECNDYVCEKRSYTFVVDTASTGTTCGCNVLTGDISYECASGTDFVSYSKNGKLMCCTSWTATTRDDAGNTRYMYRTCGDFYGTVERQYKCNGNFYPGGTDFSYSSGTLVNNLGLVSCTWDSSTNAPANGSCSGCLSCNGSLSASAPSSYTEYESTSNECYERKITWSLKTQSNTEYNGINYGDVKICSNDKNSSTSYICAKGCYGTATSSSAGCTKCPLITASGLVNYATNTTTDALKLYKLGSADTVLGSTSMRGATSVDSCYANSADSDVGLTYYQDYSGVFYWDELYNCYWE